MEALEALLPLIFGAIGIYIGVEVLLWILPYLLLAVAAAVGLCVLVGLYIQREEIARWYYFTFSPHPAEPAVRFALAKGRLLDGDRLAAALGEAPSDNRILREVRIAQGERLVAEMRQMSAQMIRETLRSARTDNARAAVVGVDEAIALAAVALERAKAAHAASRRL